MSQAQALFDHYRSACPLVAILRGITPEEIIEVGLALAETGFTLIEVPLNSPNALASIEKLANVLVGQALVGAGTVLTVEEVDAVAQAGGQLIVSPDCKVEVIEASLAQDLVSLPAYFTVSEAFRAIDAGAHGLKLFPADSVNPAMLKAQRAVLPKQFPVIPVGGITPQSMSEWQAAGANGFGIGSNLYRPGKSISDIVRDATQFIQVSRGLA